MPVYKFLCWAMLVLACASARSEPVRIITENYPPYNFLQNGELTGLSVDILKAVMDSTELEYTIEVMPWARGMMTTEKMKNVFIFSMRRIPSREERYLWVGTLCSASHSVFTLASRDDIHFDSIDDIKQYTVGTTIEDSRETVLIEKGVPVEQLTRISGDDSYLRNYMKLKYGRIDVWPMDDAVAFHIVKSYGDNPEQVLKKAYIFDSGESDYYYLAANLHSDPRIVEEISDALFAFKETDAYLSILQKWNGAP